MGCMLADQALRQRQHIVFALAQGYWLGRKLDQVEAGAARTE